MAHRQLPRYRRGVGSVALAFALGIVCLVQLLGLHEPGDRYS